MAPGSGNDLLIDESDFRSNQIEVMLKNLTARSDHPVGIGAEAPQFIEYGSNSLTVEIPSKSCSSGHQLLIRLTVTNPSQKKISFEATGKVKKIEEIGDKKVRAHVVLLQYKEQEWQDFLGVFERRQKEIEEFFKTSRGY